MKNIIERYLNNALMDVTDKINERLRKFVEEYFSMQFGKRFFLDILVRNVLMDLAYYRDSHLKAHLQLCRQNKIPKTAFAVEHAEHYLKRLNDVELKSFVQIIKMVDFNFPLSAEERTRRGKETSRIANEILEELLAEEKAGKI